MQFKRPPFVVIILAVVILLAGAYYLYNATRPANTALTASGTIEATEILIAPEISGKVTEVLVNQGDIVKADDVLFRLDGTLPQAQRNVAAAALNMAKAASLTAEAAVATSQAQYDAAVTAARAQEGSRRLADWSKKTPNYFEQPNWYFSRAEQITAAQTGVETAQQRLQQAQANLEKVTGSLDNADFIAAETRLSNARTNYLIAKTVDSHAQMTGGKVSPEDVTADIPTHAPSAYRIKIAIAHDMSGESDILNVSQDDLDVATTELDDAEKEYSDLLGTKAAERVQEARAELSVAKERYEVALDSLNKLQSGEYSPQVKIASVGLDQAKAGLQQAQDAVKQAEANLSLLDTQISRLTVYAPTDGMILTRAVEPGEVAMPGSGVLTMARLSDLTITVYIPEDRYGEISIGQTANVTVDSFPGENFTATVMYISDKAEFTPRNVQTVEGRKTTVFAIKLMLKDADGKLKPGMPADVLFKSSIEEGMSNTHFTVLNP